MTVYCFDTSAFIEGWVRRYPQTQFPSLWRQLEGLVKVHRLKVVDEVINELSQQDDGIGEWCKQFNNIAIPLDRHVQIQTKSVLAAFPKLTDSSKGRGRADPFVIALAMVHGLVVVTAEKSRPGNPKIPDACLHYNIKCIELLDVIKAEQWVF